MVSNSSDFMDYVKERLSALPNIHSARLFGGVGLSVHAIQFAMVIKNTLYFVVDDQSRGKYEALGSICFSYTTKQKRVQVRRYYEVPADLLDDQEQLLIWAQEAIDVAQKTRKKS